MWFNSYAHNTAESNSGLRSASAQPAVSFVGARGETSSIARQSRRRLRDCRSGRTQPQSRGPRGGALACSISTRVAKLKRCSGQVSVKLRTSTSRTPSAPGMYSASPIIGTGSSESALKMAQHSLSAESILRVPVGLLADCEQKHREVLANSGRKATNLYRRVSVVSHQNNDVCKRRRSDSSNACVVCTVTLVKSSKDPARSGVRLKCPCDARVCITCFRNNPVWYEAEPHYGACSTTRYFTCHACSLFQRVSMRRCCAWLCVDCFKHAVGPCVVCAAPVDRDHRGETRELWIAPAASDSRKQPRCADNERNSELESNRYRSEIRKRVLEKIANTRHISAGDVGVLFGKYNTEQPCPLCTKKARDPMCVKCTPVTALLELLGKNPRPLIASLAERIIPSRALTRHVYNRATLITMLNDPNVPFCINDAYCKGALLINERDRPTPLRSLVGSGEYKQHTADYRAQSCRLAASACIVCILFNQSATIAHMLNPEKLYMEPEPREPVYYFNVKLRPDVGVPEVRVDEQHGFLINFQGSVGCYKPTFYYNWRDMLKRIRVERDESITLLPVS